MKNNLDTSLPVAAKELKVLSRRKSIIYAMLFERKMA